MYYICPVCQKRHENDDGFYSICSICGWENEGNLADPDDDLTPNHISLNRGRENYKKYGDSYERCKHGEKEHWCVQCFPDDVE